MTIPRRLRQTRIGRTRKARLVAASAGGREASCADAVEKLREVFEPLRDEMDDLSLALDAADDAEHAG